MNWLQFVASIVGSLAWPSVVFACVLILRKPLRDLLPLLQRLKYKEFELEFGKRIQEISAEVSAELPPTPKSLPPSPAEESAILRLAEVSPRAAVLEAWREVESTALSAARKLGGDQFRNTTLTYHAIRFLEQSKKLDGGIVSLLRDLRGLRNQAAHAPEFALSAGSAVEYAAAAHRVASYLRDVAGAA